MSTVGAFALAAGFLVLFFFTFFKLIRTRFDQALSGFVFVQTA